MSKGEQSRGGAKVPNFFNYKIGVAWLEGIPSRRYPVKSSWPYKVGYTRVTL